MHGRNERTWYATTDADTEVGADWLVRQLGSGADMVLGLVRVGQWRHHSEQAAELYEARYSAETALHQHIHGANMGFRAEAYWRVGGFAALASGEDVDLVDRFRADGLRVCPDENLWVTTSDRRRGRAPGGFSEHLAEVSREVGRRQGGRGVMTTSLVLEWLRAGRLQLPLPGSGETAQRWRRLAQLTEIDVVAGRLAEAHADAAAILAELGGPLPRAGELWGVWAAEAADAVVIARACR